MAQTSYGDIKSYNTNLVTELNDNGIPFSLQNFPLLVRMESSTTEGLGRLIQDSGCTNMLAVFGLDNNGAFTISFLALDTDMKVDERHINDELNGEENWPPSSITFFGEAPEDAAQDVLP